MISFLHKATYSFATASSEFPLDYPKTVSCFITVIYFKQTPLDGTPSDVELTYYLS